MKKHLVTHEEATVELMMKKRPKTWIFQLIILGVVVFFTVYAFDGAKINPYRLQNFWLNFRQILLGFRNMNTEFLFSIFDDRGDFDRSTLPYLTLETIAIAFLGTFLASLLALPIAFITAKNIAGKKLSKVGETILVVIRTFPEIILALIFVRIVGTGALAGIFAIGIHSIGMLGKLFAEAIENMDRGPIEALDAVGANLWQKIRYGVAPQVLPDFLSMALYRFDINVRAATVLGIVSAGGIGTPLAFAIGEFNWETMSAIMVAIIVMVISIDLLSSKLRQKLI